MSMTSWQELAQADPGSFDAAVDKVLSQGRALIASMADFDGARRADRVSGMNDDELRAVAFAAATPQPAD